MIRILTFLAFKMLPQVFVFLLITLSCGHSAGAIKFNDVEDFFLNPGVEEVVNTVRTGNLTNGTVPCNTTTLQNNCNCNCNCNPTVTCAPPFNKTCLQEGTETTSYLLQLVKDQQQQIRTLLSLQETCNSATSITRIASRPRDCQELRIQGITISGTYDIYPLDSHGSIQVYCDMKSKWEGWTVIQRREDGSVNFHRGWGDYRHGFGNVNSEHWIGNDNIHRITAQGIYELTVELEDWEGKITTATYDKFRVGELGTQYKLILGRYQGDAGDGLGCKNNQIFGTFDDGRLDCVDRLNGGWWGLDSCRESNLNGHFYDFNEAQFGHQYGVVWKEWKGETYSLKRTEMKIKPSK